MDDIRRRRFDILVCDRLDRRSRSLFDAVHVLDQLRKNNVRLVTLADGISFDGPYGSLMYALVSGLDELDREAIHERVKAGSRAAKARGVRLGRKVAAIDIDGARGRVEGMTMREIAEYFDISVRTLQRRLCGATKIPSKTDPQITVLPLPSHLDFARQNQMFLSYRLIRKNADPDNEAPRQEDPPGENSKGGRG